MKCDIGEWTVVFPHINSDNPFTIKPRSLTMKQSRGELDYCRAEFPANVGYHIMPETQGDEGVLLDEELVEIYRNDKLVHSYLFEPNNVRYGDHATHMELIDLQQSLDDGVVDMQRGKVYIERIYNDVFEKRKNKDIITDLKFSIPENMEFGRFKDTDISSSVPWVDIDGDGIKENEAHKVGSITNIQAEVEFDEISPLRAIWKLNKKYRLQSWIDKNRTLWVGIPEAAGNFHVAAQNDSRVWHYEDEQIRTPKRPIKELTVWGKFFDEPGVGSTGDIIDYFDPDKTHADLKPMATAVRTDIQHGETKTIHKSKLSWDGIEDYAKVALYEEMKKQNSGSITINPMKSTEFTPLHSLSVGDYITVVPDDRYYQGPWHVSTGDIEEFRIRYGRGDFKDKCGTPTPNELYNITEITHNIEGGHWSIDLDIGMYSLDAPVQSQFRFFDPQEKRYYKEEDVFDGNWVEGI